MALLCLLLGCGDAHQALEPPPEGSGGWVRVDLKLQAEAPLSLRSLNPVSCLSATYRQGEATVRVQACSFRAEASAFEARQRHAEPGTAAYHRGKYFVICSGRLGASELAQFVRTLESIWPPAAR